MAALSPTWSCLPQEQVALSAWATTTGTDMQVRRRYQSPVQRAAISLLVKRMSMVSWGLRKSANWKRTIEKTMVGFRRTEVSIPQF